MELLIQLASPILTAVMAVGGAYIAFNNRLTILETKNDVDPHGRKQDLDQIAEIKAEIAEIRMEVAVIKSEITGLTGEMRKHNSLMERTFKLEARVDSIEDRI